MPMESKSQISTEPRQSGVSATGEDRLVTRRLPRERPPTHPGEMLLHEFLEPLGVSQSALAVRLGVSFPRLNEVIRGRRGVTPDTALRLARVVGMSADFWLGLQQDWDLWHAMRSDKAAAIAELEPLRLPRESVRSLRDPEDGENRCTSIARRPAISDPPLGERVGPPNDRVE